MLARENFDGPHVWHNRRTLLQDAQKGRPARLQQLKDRGVPSGYVEGLNDARTLQGRGASLGEEAALADSG